MKESRKLKITFTKGGSGSTTCKLGIPTKWVNDIGLTPDDRELEVEYDSETKSIMIKKFSSKSKEGKSSDLIKKLAKDEKLKNLLIDRQKQA